MLNNFDLEKAIKIQKKLQEKIIMKCENSNFKNVAGVDLAYWQKNNKEYAVCCIVVINSITKEVVEKQHFIDSINFPYIPGFLAFRELPLILKTVEKLKIIPDLYMFDGNGYLHPHHMGIATYSSFFLKKATIGIAKNYYKINNIDYIIPDNENNAYTDIVINNEVYGRTLRTHKNVKPIFISVGNYIDIDTTTKIVCNFVNKESRIPLPTRLADIETKIIRKEEIH